MKRLSWFVFFSIIAVSCLDQPDCYQLNNNVAGFGFKIFGGSTDYWDVTEVVSVGAEEVKWADTLGVIGVYLDPYANEISFAMTGLFGNSPVPETKNISLSYKSLVQFVSEDCGERHVFSDLKVLSTDFDSVKLMNDVPSNTGIVNFDIYRCPDTDLLYVDLINDQPVKTIARLPEPAQNVNNTITSVLLPLHLDADATSFVFTYSDGAVDATDTLTVTYRRTQRTIVNKCGTQFFVDNLAFDDAKTGFSKVTVATDSIYDLPNKVNIEITR